ncbi:hypothetical protein AVEN_172425-1 [Araneus ventricosus]|uniref:Uncharacterized protein n=1 Tax=Araneus ventricosus TaxID=182803 RepID=A0A4Y2LPC9_ARAVE|nr:hypothetical protein AVEN_172425-1 [Araneus ventricosus]
MGPRDDLPAKPELLHWGRMRRARRELVPQLCSASVNSAIKVHGIKCRVTAATFGGNVSCVRALKCYLLPPDGACAPMFLYDFVSYRMSYHPSKFVPRP